MNSLKATSLKLLLIACIILSKTQVLQAQTTAETKPFYNYRNEVGVNATALLGNLLSLTNNDSSPYGFQYCRHKTKSNIRLGFNVFSNQDSDFDNLGNEKTLNEQDYGMRVSYERNYQLTSRFMVHYGIDVLGKYNSSYSTTANFFSNKVERISGGVGPALRIVFKLHERIFLMTESTLYGEYGNKIQKTILNNVVTNHTSDFYSAKLVMPTSLYISIHF